MDTRSLRAIGDQNLIESFRVLIGPFGDPAGGWASFGGALAVVTGMPLAYFNPVIVVDNVVVAADVRRAIAWSRARGVTPSVHVREDLDPVVRETAIELGLEPRDQPELGMALWPLPTTVSPAPSELAIRTIPPGDIALLEDFHASLGPVPGLRRALGAPLVAGSDAILVVGHVDGRPVTHAAAIRSPDAVGIYAFGTAEAARRRGYGRAIVAAAIDAGRSAWGVEVAVLQSNDMGLPVYRSLGFVDVCGYIVYAPGHSAEPTLPQG